MSARVAVETLLEISTLRGLVYVQCIAVHPVYGPLLRVIDGFEKRRPVDLAAVAQRTSAFVAFVAVENGLRLGMFDVVGQFPVPEGSMPFPLFRHPVYRPGSSQILRWQLWDGEQKYPVDHLTPPQMDLPILEIIFPSAFVRRLATGWRPADEPEYTTKHPAISTSAQTRPDDTARFFFYVPDEAGARALELELRTIGFEVETRVRADAAEWGVTASRRISDPSEILVLRPKLESLASSVGGEYDGWEYALFAQDQ
jgi:hypothetical protein